MEKSEIIEILSEWNFWKDTKETGIPRPGYCDEILDRLGLNKIVSVVGVRRSGKSTILKQVIGRLVGKTRKEDTLLVNLEERRWLRLDLNFLNRVYESYKEIIKPTNKPYIFLDEIQKLDEWERFVRSLNEKKEANVVITGSSSKLMSKELSSLLTGRTLDIEIFPLSFREYLGFRGINTQTEKDTLFSASEIKSHFREYLEFGGFPEIVLTKDAAYKHEILWKYFEDIISKDTVERFKIRNPEKIEVLAKYYLTNISALHTFNSISRFLKAPVETISRYSNNLETSRLIFFLKRFSFSVKEQENSPRKVYSIDHGLSNAIGFKFTEGLGKIAENIVFLELLRRGTKSKDMSMFYWKDSSGKEVDFIIKSGVKIAALIQVCWNLDDENTKKRELRSLLKASKKLKCKNLLVITEHLEDKEKVNGNEIIYKPLWKWLLSNQQS